MIFCLQKWLVVLFSVLHATLLTSLLSLHPTPASGDADFESVRYRYDYRERSGRHGDPKGKYWHESVFHPHYDGRFTDKVLSYEQQTTNLTALIQSYLFSMADLGAETWIIHGTLLGWYWNRKILPWDSDIDVQMTAHSVAFLARYYNMTIHDFGPKRYMLEINPCYVNTSYADRLNVIDGRWIDIQTGLFIDITAVRIKEGTHGEIMTSKDKHESRRRDVFPLRESVFEGVPALVPNNYLKLLAEEYGRQSMIKLQHAEYVWPFPPPENSPCLSTHTSHICRPFFS